MKLISFAFCLLIGFKSFTQNIEIGRLLEAKNIYFVVELVNETARIKSSDSRSNIFGLKSFTLSNKKGVIHFKNFLEMLDFLDESGFETIQNINNESGLTNIFLLRRKNFLAKN